MNKFEYYYVDTCILADIIIQYFDSAVEFGASQYISKEMAQKLNVALHSSGDNGMVLTSSFAVIELINKFDTIFNGTPVNINKLYAFIKEPPGWITIEDTDSHVAPYLLSVPETSPNGDQISGDDAIHIATALSREEELFFLTTDGRIKQLDLGNITFL